MIASCNSSMYLVYTVTVYKFNAQSSSASCNHHAYLPYHFVIIRICEKFLQSFHHHSPIYNEYPLWHIRYKRIILHADQVIYHADYT